MKKKEIIISDIEHLKTYIMEACNGNTMLSITLDTGKDKEEREAENGR